MVEKHERKSPQRKEEDDSSASSGKAKKEAQANETLAITDDVLADIDRALKKACDSDDDIVSDEDFSDRARVFVENYQQKGANESPPDSGIAGQRNGEAKNRWPLNG